MVEGVMNAVTEILEVTSVSPDVAFHQIVQHWIRLNKFRATAAVT
jgi:hypothetical protein